MSGRRVLVTGAAGNFGSWVIRELRENGYQVIATDRRAQAQRLRGVRFEQFSLRQVGRLGAALERCSHVVHLAAFNSPLGRRPELVFRANTGATIAVLEAAARAGVRAAVIASSTSAFGFTYAPEPLSPRYVPVDERHPLNPLDAYALSKAVDEQCALSVHRRTGMAVLALRFHWIALPGAAAERARRLAADPAAGARELWGYVDARDAARACRLALEHEQLGHAVMNIAAADSLGPQPTAALVRRFHPTTTIRRSLSRYASAWSSAEAGRLIGYTPQFSWRRQTR